MKAQVLFLLAMLLPVAAAAHDVIIDGIGYNINNVNKTAEIVRRDDGFTGYTGFIHLPPSIEYQGENYSVVAIGDYAFSYCKSLSSVSIPSSVTFIGEGAFQGCENLDYIEMRFSNVTKVRNRAFDNTKWFNSQPDGLVYLENVAYKYKGGIPTGAGIELRTGTKAIADFAFQGCNKLASVALPEGLVAIGESSFDGCHALSSPALPSSLTVIDNNAFIDCRAMTAVVIPDNVTAIGSGAYWGCSGIKTLTIGRSIASIGDMAFAKCTAIDTVTVLSLQPPSISSNTFSTYDMLLCVPETVLEAYGDNSVWGNFSQIVPIIEPCIASEKCATPTIAYDNGELVFSCETDGATFISEVKAADAKSNEGGRVKLEQIYIISVFAACQGYADSDVAIATIGWRNGRPIMEGFTSISLETDENRGDVNEDGSIDVADIATIISIMAGKTIKE